MRIICNGIADVTMERSIHSLWIGEKPCECSRPKPRLDNVGVVIVVIKNRTLDWCTLVTYISHMCFIYNSD